MFLPQLGHGKRGGPQTKDVGVVLTLSSLRTPSELPLWPARRQPVKIALACCCAEAEDDERGGRRRWIAAQPLGVGGADGLGQAVGAAENLDGAVLAVVAGGDAEMRLLIGRQRIANLRRRCAPTRSSRSLRAGRRCG